MTEEQARVATIIETTPCAQCGAAKQQPCREQKRGRVWLASVHYIRRDQAARIRNADVLLWRRRIAQAREINFEAHAEYLRIQARKQP
jgi:hypothetical protein